MTSHCTVCNRSFANVEALQQHLRDSLVHKLSFECKICNRSFGTEEALQQHLRDSPVHAPSFECETCNRSFGSEEALQQHLRDSPVHRQNIETPLDAFFRSYPTFDYDPTLPPNESYANLKRHMGWRDDRTKSINGWNKYQEALEMEMEMWYGAEDDLTAWHVLCRAINIKPLPNTCEECEQATRRTHVNIIDLIEHRRSNKGRVQTFRNVQELRAYTLETQRVYPNRLGPNSSVVLRHLLRNMFREKS
ncbi:hypothetical protein CGRA01v4_03988 [Colletotrichum graminicola]|uniref:C2H2-type domain-containing protein n=1 Tax=Colletotrichum graminicola (strain M1.001 / M2 / FGSC 10212) TaxID=645133 RepID=E3QZ70_COLGM|nr:uncharacterized protein GLRG_11302 [Colletotrichum graminicola M1.001]EFQ36158.1 hypothetical protein GLRG_11302 [Colletotrichum graminicola M1.001]WDK12708.1 hypothetical protein CGRA01v4_03988 [Colletotrichum graminicola]